MGRWRGRTGGRLQAKEWPRTARTTRSWDTRSWERGLEGTASEGTSLADTLSSDFWLLER